MTEARQAESSDCFHCGLPIPAKVDFQAAPDGVQHQFCCFGCQSVCSAIYDAGLQGYYQRTPEGGLPTNLGPRMMPSIVSIGVPGGTGATLRTASSAGAGT